MNDFGVSLKQTSHVISMFMINLVQRGKNEKSRNKLFLNSLKSER